MGGEQNGNNGSVDLYTGEDLLTTAGMTRPDTQHTSSGSGDVMLTTEDKVAHTIDLSNGAGAGAETTSFDQTQAVVLGGDEEDEVGLGWFEGGIDLSPSLPVAALNSEEPWSPSTHTEEVQASRRFAVTVYDGANDFHDNAAVDPEEMLEIDEPDDQGSTQAITLWGAPAPDTVVEGVNPLSSGATVSRPYGLRMRGVLGMRTQRRDEAALVVLQGYMAEGTVAPLVTIPGHVDRLTRDAVQDLLPLGSHGTPVHEALAKIASDAALQAYTGSTNELEGGGFAATGNRRTTPGEAELATHLAASFAAREAIDFGTGCVFDTSVTPREAAVRAFGLLGADVMQITNVTTGETDPQLYIHDTALHSLPSSRILADVRGVVAIERQSGAGVDSEVGTVSSGTLMIQGDVVAGRLPEIYLATVGVPSMLPGPETPLNTPMAVPVEAVALNHPAALQTMNLLNKLQTGAQTVHPTSMTGVGVQTGVRVVPDVTTQYAWLNNRRVTGIAQGAMRITASPELTAMDATVEMPRPIAGQLPPSETPEL